MKLTNNQVGRILLTLQEAYECSRVITNYNADPDRWEDVAENLGKVGIRLADLWPNPSELDRVCDNLTSVYHRDSEVEF